MKTTGSGAAVKFFCEFCGSQVRAADKICPHCNSMFSQVRCQGCGFQGESKLFLKGCPVCGFAGVGSGDGRQLNTRIGKNQRTLSAEKSFQDGYILESPKKKSGGTPGWTWILFAVALVSVILVAAAIISSTR